MGPQRAKMLLLGSVRGPGLCGSLPLVQENGQPCPTPQASAQVSSGAFSLAPSSALITLLLPRVLPVFLSLCPLSLCPLLSCVHSSSGSRTARIQLQFILWSPKSGASGPRTWWCQCWGGQGAPSSRPGCRTCCDAGWCGLPRAQVTEAGWGCASWPPHLPPFPWNAYFPLCRLCVAFVSLSGLFLCLCLQPALSLDLTTTLCVPV